MKRIRNSLKVIISLVSVFVVAVATIMTVILVNNKRKPEDETNLTSYMLTSEQKLLVNEINASVNSSVSAGKQSIFEYSSKFDEDDMNIDAVTYFNDSVWWSFNADPSSDDPERADLERIVAYVFNSASDNSYSTLISKISEMEQFSSYENPKLIRAVKNHFLVKFESGSSLTYAFVTVDNYVVTVNKVFDNVTLDVSENVLKRDGKNFKFFLGEFYFVVLSYDAEDNAYYEFFEYKDNYDGYESFKLQLSSSELELGVDIPGSNFNIDGKVVVNYSVSQGFIRENENNNPNEHVSIFGKVTLTQTRVESTQDVSGSEFVDGDYYTYSYVLKIDGEEKTLDMTGYNKVNVVYAGENYFGLFFQKIDENHSLVNSGEMVYFDYELNKIASYSAKSSSSTIIYSNGTLILTKEGMFSAKNEVQCSKVYGFENLNAEFYQILASGNFILKDSRDNLIVYNFNLSSATEFYMENVIAYLDDNSLIFVKNDIYYIYYFSTNTVTKVDYVVTSLTDKTGLFFTGNETDGYALRSSKKIIQDNIESFQITGDYIIVNTADETKTYCISSEITETGNVLGYSFESVGATQTEYYEKKSEIENYSITSISTPEDDVVYSYADKVETEIIGASKMLINATHCFTEGDYTNLGYKGYYDYFELAYTGQNSNGLANYRPLRIYYRVDVSDGNPKLTIISFGHHSLATVRTGLRKDYNINDCSFIVTPTDNLQIGSSGTYTRLGTKDSACSTSYDTNSSDLGYSYLYTGIYSSIARKGFKILTIDNKYTFKIDSGDYDFYSKVEVYGESIRVSLCLTLDFYLSTGHLDEEHCYFGQTKLSDSEFLVCNTLAGYYYEEYTDQKPNYTSDYFKDFAYYDQLYIKPAVVGVSDSYYNYSTLMDNDKDYILTTQFVSDNIAQYDLTSNFDTIAVYNGTTRTMYNLCLNDKQYYNADEKTMLALGYSNDLAIYLVGGTLVGLTTPNIYNNTSVSSLTLYNAGSKSYISNMIEFKAYSNTSNYMNNDYTNVKEGVIEDTNTKYYYMTYNTPYYIYQSGGLNKFRYIYCVYEPETFYLEIDYNIASSTEDGQGIDDEIDYLQNYTGITIGNDSQSTFTNTWAYKNIGPEMFGDYTGSDKFEPKNFYNNYTRMQSGIVKTDGSFTEEYINSENNKETSAVIHEYKSEDCRAYYIIIDGVKYFFEKNISITFSNYEDIVGMATAYFTAYRGIDVLEKKCSLNNTYGYINSINKSKYYCLANNQQAINNFYYQQGDESVRIRITSMLGQGYVAFYHKYNTHERVSSYYINTHYQYSADGSTMTKNNDYSGAVVSEKFRFLYNDSIIISELPVHNHYKFKGFDIYYFTYENGVLGLKKLDYQLTFDGMTEHGVEINPFTINLNSYYLASGKKQNNNTELSNYYTYGKNDESHPIKLVAIWEPIEITINAVLWTQESRNDNHLGLKYVNGEIKGGQDSTIITDKSTNPVFYKAGKVIDELTIDKGGNIINSKPDGLVDELLKFSYLKTKTFASIYDLLAEKGYNSAGIYSVGLECQFAGWAFLDDDGFYRVTDRTFYSEGENNYSETMIASFVGETTQLTIYAYYFTMHYNFSVSLDPMGGSVDENTSKDYFSSGMVNSKADPAQYKMSVKKTSDVEFPYKYTAGYSETGYEELSILEGSTNYFKRFDNIYYCGDTLTIKLEITKDNYYFRRIVVSNLTLKNDSGAYRKYTVVFEYDIKQGASAASWSVELECEDDGATLNGSTSKDGSIRNFVFGSYAYNSESNVFSFNGSERELTIGIRNISWPGTLDVEKQVLSGYGGFEMEVVVDNYTLENENVSFDHVDQYNQTIDNDDITATYDRSSLISSQPLTDQYGNAIGGGQNGYIWIDSNRYHVTIDATTAESGYYEVSAIGGTPLKLDEEYNYESFIRQDITQSTTMVVYYNSKTKMVYYLANVQAYNIEPIYDEDDYAIVYKYSIMVCDDKQVYFEYDGKRFYGYKSNISIGNIFKIGISGYYVFKTIASSSETVFAVRSNYSSYNNLFYTSGNDKIYCQVFQNGSVKFRVKTDTLKADAVPSMGRKISFNNTRMLVIDPEQSLVHNSQTYTDMSISTNYELKYYISSLIIGGTNFTFGQVTRNVTTDNTKLGYGYLNLNNFSSTSQGRVDRYTQKAGVTFDYFGEIYTINDAYVLTINKRTGYDNASTVYYYFIARSPEGFIRYFLVYDETISSLENRTQVYDINVTFKPMVNKLNVNVTEEDVYMHSHDDYSYTHTSFDLLYSLNYSNMVISNSGEITYNLKTITNKSFKRNLVDKYNIGSESFLQYYFYQSVASDDDLISDFANTTLTSVSWSSLAYFDPTQTFRLQLYARAGYVIKTFKIYVGKLAYKDSEGTEHAEAINQCITFELDIESSFENLLRYSTSGNYSYTGTVDDVFKSMLVYRIKDNNYVPNANSGYELNTAGVPLKRGLMYSNYKSSNWTYGNSDTYTLDYIYTLIGSMYEDVRIDITTTSYTEFLFENGSDGLNPLLKNNVSSGGKTYVDIDVDQTYFTFLISDVDDDGNPVIVELPQYDEDNNNNYILRYYPYGTSSTSSGNLSPGTIRMIFFGTGSKIQNGLHVLATTEEHSVYFTNARFYNEKYLETETRSTDAFKNLVEYSGRTKDDEKITDKTKTDKMVYFLTNKMVDQNYWGYTYKCDPKYFNLSCKNTEESSHKFFVALTACLNEINVETSSYLYNDYHTSNNSIWLDSGVKYSYNKYNSSTKYIYKFGTHYSGSNPDNKLLIIGDSSSKIYQLDNLSKTNSWFNDTVLSNIQYYSNQENYKYDNSSNILTWADRDADDPKNSALMSVKSGGLDFSWSYYEIAGYYLKYIMVEIADLESYYVIDVSKLNTTTVNNSSDNDLIIGTFDITDSSGFSYQFVLRYVCDNESSYGRFEFYPVAFEKDENGDYIKDGTDYIIDLFKSVSLMSNNIKVAFLSNALSYKINYHGEYTDGNGVKKTPSRVSTYSSMKITHSSPQKNYNSGTTYHKTIYYDSMIKLDASLSLSGYTFIGWGSEYYYSNGSLYSRYTETTDKKVAPEWNSSSSWYDPTPYFVQAGKTGSMNATIYNTFYSNHKNNSALPSTAFYVNGGYFMTDTGYKGTETGVLTQNYNFFSNYITIFSEQIGKWKTGNFAKTASYRTRINLYPIFKVNTYAIQFDPNNSKGDNYYIDFNSAGSWNLNLASDNIRFTQVETVTGVGQKTVNYVAYINFDTNNWVYSSSYDLKLLYAYCNSINNPYTISSMDYPIIGTYSNPVSKLAIDMYGYTWLGWYYTKLSDVKQSTINNSISLNSDTLVIDSLYSTNGKIGGELPSFNMTFIEKMKTNGSYIDFDSSDVQAFVYYGQHKASSLLNRNTGYVYFYDYRGNEQEASVPFAENYKLTYNAVNDYLNIFKLSADGKPAYEKESASNMILSYYDTSLNKNAYEIKYDSLNDMHYLLLNKIADKTSGTMRVITLFAAWAENTYTTIYEKLDGSSEFYSDALTNVEKWGVSSSTYNFNDESLAKYLIDTIDMVNNRPATIGWDFVGWSFSFIPNVSGSLYYDKYASAVNTASPILYLCKDLLAYYTQLDGATGTSDIESNILMINNSRLSSEATSSWILNKEGTAEQLGDSESISGTTRYVYLFPVWREQTFSMNISLNIKKEELANLYEKDSDFTVALYESDSDGNFNGKFTGVSSSFYTYQKTAGTETDGSKYTNYFNDLVANISFEIGYTEKLSEARLSFAGKTYHLKDLFVTSAGYYFLGLMYNNTSTDTANDGFGTYVVKNTLKSVLKPEDGLVSDFETGETGNVEYLNSGDARFYDLYSNFYITRQTTSASPNSSGDYSKLTNGISGMNVSYKSTNFGHISLKPYQYGSSSYYRATQDYYIMSEIVNGQYYNFIFVNNTKFYVVYYFYESEQFKDVLTFDKTFLYYNETINGVNYKYTVYFDANGNPYYVKDGFKAKVSLNSKVKIALYKNRRNTLLVEKDSNGKDVIVTYSNKRQDGSLMYSSGAVVSDNKILGTNASFSFHSTRGVTLYAHWQKKTITSTIENGNNVGSDSNKNPNKNPGLAGWYSITNSSTNTVKSTLSKNAETTSYSNKNIKLEYDFYSNIKYEFLPYFNGRYLSEMILEFDTISETNSGITSNFVMIHNTLSLRFVWNNEKNRITIETVSLNGISAGNVVATVDKSTYFANTFSLNILSVLDKYNLSRSGTTGSGFYIYEYNKGSCHDRLDINPINVDLMNVMTSIKFTCKYSIQTYNVQIYNVVGDTELVLSEGHYKTTFSSLEAMLENSNYNPANSVYGASFNSSLNFNSSNVGTISTDCAQSLVSYNVPYYYFVNSGSDTTATTVDGKISTAIDSNPYYGFDYIYKGNYEMGSTQTKLIQYNFSLDNLKAPTNYSYQGWYTFRSVTSGYVVLDSYISSTPIKSNVSIYGYYLSQATATKVLFYYWDPSAGQYVQYMNNVQEYTSGTTGSLLTPCVGGYKISQLPSSGIGTWPTNEQFVGYVYIDTSILSDFKLKTEDSKYGTSDYENKSAYSSTQGDAYSQLIKSYSSSYWDVYYTNYISSLNCIDLFKYRLKVYKNKYYPGSSSAQIEGKSFTYLDAVRLGVQIDVAGSKMTVYKDFKMLNASTVLATSRTYYAIPIFDSYRAPSISSINKLSNLKFSITTMDNAVTSNIFKYNSQYTIYYHPDIDLRIAFIDTKTYKSSDFNLTTYLNAYTSTYSLANGVTIDSTVTTNSTNTKIRYGKMTAKAINDSSNKLIRNEYSFEFNCYRNKVGSTINTYNFYIVVYYAESGNVAFTNSAQEILFSYSSTNDKYSVNGVSTINKVPTAQDVTVLKNPLTIYSTHFATASALIRENFDEYTQESKILYAELVVYIGLQILETGCIQTDVKNEFNLNHYYGLGSYWTALPEQKANDDDYGMLRYNLEKCIEAINNHTALYTDAMGFVRLVYSIAAYSVYKYDSEKFSSPADVPYLNYYYENAKGYDYAIEEFSENNIGIIYPGEIIVDRYTGSNNMFGDTNRHAAIFLYVNEANKSVTYMDCFGIALDAKYGEDYRYNEVTSYTGYRSYIYYKRGNESPYKFNYIDIIIY